MKPTVNQETQLISTLYNAGYSMRQIAKELLLSPQTIKMRLALSGTYVRSSSEGVKLASKQGRLAVPRKKMLS